jgi:preprotein translocase subunit SecB
MNVKISCKDRYIINFLSTGAVEFIGDFEENEGKNLMHVNAPAIMFPYLRSFVSFLSSSLGTIVAPLVIPPQIFQETLPERLTEQHISL